MLEVAKLGETRHHEGRDLAQPCDDLSRLVWVSHMGIAGCETAIRLRVRRIILDCEEQFWHSLIEAPVQKMRPTDHSKRITDAGARTKAERDSDVLDRGIGLARPHSERPANVPATSEARLSATARSANPTIAPMSSPKKARETAALA